MVEFLIYCVLTHHMFCLLSDIFPHTRHILHCTMILQYPLDIEHMNLPDDFHIQPFYLKNQGLRFKNLIDQVQINEYETDLYFLKIFRSNTSVCLIFPVVCKSCEPICEPEITPVVMSYSKRMSLFKWLKSFKKGHYCAFI